MRAESMKKLLLVLPVFLFISGCGIFKGEVYVAFHWADNDETNRPTSISHDMTTVTQNVAEIVPGSYYLVQPGSYQITITYAGPVPPAASYVDFPFTLKAKTATLGKEDNYYDIVCFPDRTPIIQEYPPY